MKALHPRILELAYDLDRSRYTSSNQVCIASLKALCHFLKDFEPKEGSDLGRELLDEWNHVNEFIKSSYWLHAGVLNALADLWKAIQSLIFKRLTLKELKIQI